MGHFVLSFFLSSFLYFSTGDDITPCDPPSSGCCVGVGVVLVLVLVFGLWSLVFGLWSLVFGLWSLVFVFGLCSVLCTWWSLVVVCVVWSFGPGPGPGPCLLYFVDSVFVLLAFVNQGKPEMINWKSITHRANNFNSVPSVP
jgi:hypothetical protein